jgi:hypothetical protein
MEKARSIFEETKTEKNLTEKSDYTDWIYGMDQNHRSLSEWIGARSPPNPPGVCLLFVLGIN